MIVRAVVPIPITITAGVTIIVITRLVIITIVIAPLIAAVLIGGGNVQLLPGIDPIRVTEIVHPGDLIRIDSIEPANAEERFTPSDSMVISA
jgi:hypothetical protein